MSGSGRESLPVVCEWSSEPPGHPGEVGIPSGMSASGRKPTQISGIGPEALQYVR